MNPSYRRGQTIIIGHARSYRVGDVVVAFVNGKEVLKRIHKIDDGKMFLVGDNNLASTDSRTQGWLQDRHVIGKVIWPKKAKK